MIDSNKIGKFILENRKLKDLTQKELAEKIKVTDKAISKWENGRGVPDIELLESLSEILDISILELLKGEKIEKVSQENESILSTSLDYSKSLILCKEKKMKNNNIRNIIIILLFAVIIMVYLMYPKYDNEKKYIKDFTISNTSEELYYAERIYSNSDIGINKNNNIVFKEPQKMYEKFIIEYKNEISEIQKQHKLLPINRFNIKKYKTLGWQTFSSNPEFQKKIIEVTQFLDTYLNSF